MLHFPPMTQQPFAQAWAEPILIPTYPVGSPEKNPLFLEKRVYQGSSGVVYPYPVIESVADEKVAREYTAVYLENPYLKIMILPELGGRVQMAQDKTNGHPFIYHNRVIKPALVGLAGPWISGGIEFNWPQHHRPTTFSPVEWHLTTNADGSHTLFCAEIEPMFNTKGSHSFTIYPHRAYLEINVQLYNRTSEPQTFLWWANPAVHVNDHYQSIFPPDVHAVMDHGKRDVSPFPIATGTYYKVNYAPGTDISRYKNIPVPTSYMAYHSDFDFVGYYDHGQQAGMIHIANHHHVPGKKQWTWGTSDFGQAWDRQLTDEDGPYIELMCGAFTDNQPDFSWLMPGEEKRFTHIFMPFKTIGGVKNGAKEALVNLDIADDRATLGVYLTEPRTVDVELLLEGVVIWQQTAVSLSPTTPLSHTLPLPPHTRPQALTLRLLADGRELIRTTPLPDEPHPIPEPARPAPPPAEVESNEALFLHGLHLEQYRHATYAPEPYYQEALRRDPLDSRCNNALGLLLYRRGQFAAAEPYFRRAIASLTRRNPNPYDGEPHYNLGLSLNMQGRMQEAFDAFYKATWSAAWQSPAYFELARLACRFGFLNGTRTNVDERGLGVEFTQAAFSSGRLEEAVELATRSLHGNWLNHRARHLKTAVLRHLARPQQAQQEIALAHTLDPLDRGAQWEQHFLGLAEPPTQAGAETTLAIALDYAHAGLYVEAIHLLETLPHVTMAVYYAAWCRELAGDPQGLGTIVLHNDDRRPTTDDGKHNNASSAFVGVRPRPISRGDDHERKPTMQNENRTQIYLIDLIDPLYQENQDNQRPIATEETAVPTPDFCFPNQLESVPALQAAIARNPADGTAPYALGNFWYAHRQYDEAITCWELARQRNPAFPTVHRNLGLAYVNKRGDLDKGLRAYAVAFALDPTDARVLFELDQLHKKLNRTPTQRLAFLRRYPEVVQQRDDLVIEWVGVLNGNGRFAEAYHTLMQRTFHPWEGGEGKTTGQYIVALVEQARQAIAAGDFAAAVPLLHQAQVYPHNLGEGKLAGAQENHIFYYLGCAHAGLGEEAAARGWWQRAATGLTEPTSALYYNDQPPEMIFYQGLARQKLGQHAEAREIFQKLVAYGEAHVGDEVAMDYFAVSLPDFLVFDSDLTQRNVIHCHFMLGLGHWGLGDGETAVSHFNTALSLDANHQGALLHRALLSEFMSVTG